MHRCVAGILAPEDLEDCEYCHPQGEPMTEPKEIQRYMDKSTYYYRDHALSTLLPAVPQNVAVVLESDHLPLVSGLRAEIAELKARNKRLRDYIQLPTLYESRSRSGERCWTGTRPDASHTLLAEYVRARHEVMPDFEELIESEEIASLRTALAKEKERVREAWLDGMKWGQSCAIRGYYVPTEQSAQDALAAFLASRKGE